MILLIELIMVVWMSNVSYRLGCLNKWSLASATVYEVTQPSVQRTF